jgi:hypothetical protein
VAGAVTERGRRPRLAPLEPTAFMAWWWRQEPRPFRTGAIPGGSITSERWKELERSAVQAAARQRRPTTPITFEDLAWELRHQEPDLDLAALRQQYVSMAARVRRNQRLGRDPWEGIG